MVQVCTVMKHVKASYAVECIASFVTIWRKDVSEFAPLVFYDFLLNMVSFQNGYG